MQPNKFSILCTRLLNNELIQKALLHGIDIDTVSFIETQHDTSEITAALIRDIASKKATVVFTSINAVNAVTEQLVTKPEWKIFCIGGITKEAVFNFFGEEAVLGTAKNSTALSEKIIATNNANQLYFFCGDHRLDELPETLEANNITVNEVVVYTTVQTPVFIEKDYNGVIFFSPSAVHSFFSVNTVPVNVVLFAIGKTTAATIQTYCANTVITSEWPGKEQMIDQAINYFK